MLHGTIGLERSAGGSKVVMYVFAEAHAFIYACLHVCTCVVLNEAPEAVMLSNMLVSETRKYLATTVLI